MTYVMSDIHGDYAAFTNMLAQIEFGEGDVLYIAGDMADHGEDPMGLLCDISMRANVIPIAGEHDLLALRMLRRFDKLSKQGEIPDERDPEMSAWLVNGGRQTLLGFHALDADMREGILDYLADMLLFDEVEVKGQKYLIVHAGLRACDEALPLEERAPESFMSEALDSTREYFDDITVIVGHTRTGTLPDADPDMIYYGEGSVFLNCGAGRGGRLACLCLETGKEFYVS